MSTHIIWFNGQITKTFENIFIIIPPEDLRSMTQMWPLVRILINSFLRYYVVLRENHVMRMSIFRSSLTEIDNIFSFHSRKIDISTSVFD